MFTKMMAIAGLAFGTGCFVLGAVATAVVRDDGQGEPRIAISGKPVATPAPASTVRQSPPLSIDAAPVSDDLHFDLACEAEGRVIWQDDPTRMILTPNPQQWDDEPHLIVDLQAMRYCRPYQCRSRGPQPIESVSPDRIIFVDRPGLSETYRPSDGRYAMAMLDLGRIQVTEGMCTVEPFSGFPPLDNPEEAARPAP